MLGTLRLHRLLRNKIVAKAKPKEQNISITPEPGPSIDLAIFWRVLRKLLAYLATAGEFKGPEDVVLCSLFIALSFSSLQMLDKLQCKLNLTLQTYQ